MIEKLSFDNGKYEWILEDNYSSSVYRLGEFWSDTTGDNFILAIMQEITDLQKELTEAVEYLENSGVDWDEIRGGL